MLEGMGRFRTQLHRTADARPSGVAATAAVRLPAARSVRAEWRLPRLDARVPLELTPRRLASANATVARFLLEAKAVRERDIPATWNDELLVCQGALDAWVKREIGALHCLAPQFVLRPVWGSVPDRCSAPTQSVHYSQIQITWFQQDEQQWAVGRGLERLEQATPTLGATALHLLDEHSRYVYPVFTPRTAQDVASMMYWYGEEDETFALEEACADDEEARAAMREEMVTKASMTEAFPAWALAWQARNARRIGVGADRSARQR